MHEISLARNILANLEQAYADNDLRHLQAIDLKIGLLSQVEPILMEHAFKAVTQSAKKYQQVRLNIEMVPIEIHCDTCNEISIVQNYRFICPCGAPSKNVIKGTELEIDQLHFAP